jgi:hypothetical protein
MRNDWKYMYQETFGLRFKKHQIKGAKKEQGNDAM